MNQGGAQASNAPTKQGRGAAWTARVPQESLGIGGRRRRQRRQRDEVEDEAEEKETGDEDADEEEVEEEVDGKINTNTPCYQGAEARPIANGKHHYSKSQQL